MKLQLYDTSQSLSLKKPQVEQYDDAVALMLRVTTQIGENRCVRRLGDMRASIW